MADGRDMDDDAPTPASEKVRRAQAAHEGIKRRARAFSDAAYQHYDPNAGYGSRAEWAGAAEQLAAHLGLKPIPTDPLRVLGLDHPPTSKAELTRAFRKTAKVAHPDKGGSNEAMRRVVEAYETIKRERGWK